MKTTAQFHGSDLEKVEEIYGIPKEEIISFGANVNPLGISPRIREELSVHLDAITRYPDREYTKLREAISSYTGASPEHIMVGNGCTELISLFLKTKTPSHAWILGPTYSEYERAILLNGGHCQYWTLQEQENFRLDIRTFCGKLSAEYDLLVLCNPNNPTSTGISQKDMEILIKRCRELGIFLLIDETYGEFAPEDVPLSAIPLAKDYDNFMVLRGTSKFFAAPGLRLGYGITGSQELLKKMKEKQDPWSTNSLAEVAGCVMFTDLDYIARTKALISGERERLLQELSSWDTLKVYPAAANFILVKIQKPGIDADLVFDHCIRKGLMIRNCSTFDGLDNRFFRFCIMLPWENDRLVEALREIL